MLIERLEKVLQNISCQVASGIVVITISRDSCQADKVYYYCAHVDKL